MKPVACKVSHSSIKAAGTYKASYRIDFGGLNLLSHPGIAPAPAVAFSAMGLTHSTQWASSASFRPLLLEHSLIILTSYKQRNKKYSCQGGHPISPRSTIRDHSYFSAGPTHIMFQKVQRTEFPRLDQRKATALLGTCVFRAFLALREEYLPSQTTLHQSHE